MPFTKPALESIERTKATEDLLGLGREVWVETSTGLPFIDDPDDGLSYLTPCCHAFASIDEGSITFCKNCFEAVDERCGAWPGYRGLA